MSTPRDPDSPTGRAVVVWGNCQAAPIAQLIAPAVTAAGAQVVAVPPVFEVSEQGLVEVQTLVRSAAALITQPVRDEYRWPGCGADQLAALLPADARLVRFPVMYDSSAFPYQCNAHGGDGSRVDAPLTDYHDLRTLVAAERGYDVAEALGWWPEPRPELVRANAADSVSELARRDRLVDVAGADLLGPGAMFTLSHPTNRVLAEVARRVLDQLGIAEPVSVPEREFLGERRAPVDASVVDALGWPRSEIRPDWLVQGRSVPHAEVVDAHLRFYAQRPDVVADARRRHGERLARLGL